MSRKRKPAPAGLEVQMLDVGEVQAAEKNPRRISPAAQAALGKSLRRFGLVEPLVVNRAGGKYQLVSGHQRYAVLVAAGVKSVPAVVVDLPEVEARVLSLTLNNPKAQGEWTEDLAEMIFDLQKQTEISDVGLDLLIAEAQRTPNIEAIKIPRPVKRVWVLVGIPAGGYQKHAATVEALQADGEVEVHVKAD